MIKALTIKNFILTEAISIEFGSGLNVLTGETGAGKSVIIGALDYILGKRVSADLCYNKDEPAYLEAAFKLPSSKTHQKTITDLNDSFENIFNSEHHSSDTFTISRIINSNGKSNSSLNGRKINLQQLNIIRKVLIDFHSQRDQMQLLDNRYQLEILDIWSNLEPVREKFSNIYNNLKNLVEKKKQLEKEEKENADKISLYEYQIEELEKLNLQIDEDINISSELDLLINSEELITIFEEIKHTFTEQENSFLDIANLLRQRIQRIANNKMITPLLNSFDTLINITNQLSSEAEQLQHNIDVDKDKMSILEERMNEILKVKNKYKKNIPEILEYLEKTKKIVAKKHSRKDEILRISDEISEKRKDILQLTELLSNTRRNNSEPFSDHIIKDLKELSIPEATFSVDITSMVNLITCDGFLGGLSETGNDKINFLFAANKGFLPQALREIISGGELSRLLLVIKKILAGRFACPTLVLDEIDTGIGGKTAINMGKYISSLADFHQVICITHLPQIATFGNIHYRIEKVSNNMKTVVNIKKISSEERRQEIARMLSGQQTEIALKHADEILNNK